MTEVAIQNTAEHESFSSYSSSLGASLIAAALLSHVVPIAQPELGLVSSHAWQQERRYVDQSYHDSVITQAPIDQQLYFALQNLYASLVATQQDLEPDTRSLLYSNLWTLYD